MNNGITKFCVFDSQDFSRYTSTKTYRRDIFIEALSIVSLKTYSNLLYRLQERHFRYCLVNRDIYLETSYIMSLSVHVKTL